MSFCKPKSVTAYAVPKFKYLDLGLLLDVTSSMSSWIQRSKETLKSIVEDIKKSNTELKVRVCFVGYRDHCDNDSRLKDFKDFTEDIDDMKAFMDKV